MDNLSFLAQVSTGNALALNILESSLEFYQKTGLAWDRMWDLVVNPTQPLWIASLAIAKFIFGFSLFFYTYLTVLRLGIITSTKQLLDQMPLPLTVAFLFAGNGTLLSALVLGIREIFLYFIIMTLQIQIAGISVNQSLQNIQSTAIANNRARIIFADCMPLTGRDLNDCVNDPQKISQAEELLNGSPGILGGNVLQSILGVVTAGASAVASAPTAFIANAISTVFGSIWLAIIQIILLLIQFIFINIIEATSFLTAIAAPIFLGFSLFTPNAPIFVLWLTGFMGLYFVQLSYVFLIGLYGLVVSQLDQAGVPVGTVILDTAFLLYVSIFSPTVALAISVGGGIQLYERVSSNVEKIASLMIATL